MNTRAIPPEARERKMIGFVMYEPAEMHTMALAPRRDQDDKHIQPAAAERA